jgi:hypothetical protein
VGAVASEPEQVVPSPRLQPGQTAAIWGVVCVAWAVFLLPPVFGTVGFVLGAVAWRRGEERGRWVMVAAVVAVLIGLGINLLPDWFVSN